MRRISYSYHIMMITAGLKVFHTLWSVSSYLRLYSRLPVSQSCENFNSHPSALFRSNSVSSTRRFKYANTIKGNDKIKPKIATWSIPIFLSLCSDLHHTNISTTTKSLLFGSGPAEDYIDIMPPLNRFGVKYIWLWWTIERNEQNIKSLHHPTITIELRDYSK